MRHARRCLSAPNPQRGFYQQLSIQQRSPVQHHHHSFLPRGLAALLYLAAGSDADLSAKHVQANGMGIAEGLGWP